MYKVISMFLWLYSITALAQWVPQNSPGLNPNYMIQAMVAVDDNTVWAVADTNFFAPGTIFTPKYLRTTDGGVNWTVGNVTGVENAFLMDITAIDADTAWVTVNNFAGGGGIYKTSDGGANWIFQESFQSLFIHFFDGQNGVQVNRNFVLTTTDGGDNWTEVPSGNTFEWLAGEFNIVYSTSNARAQVGDTIWLSTSKGRVYRSTNRGHNWTVSQTSLGQNRPITTLAFKDANNGIAASALDGSFDIAPNLLAITDDGGDTWTTISGPPSPAPSAVGIAYMPGTNGTYVIASPTGFGEIPGSAYTLDGGTTWTGVDDAEYNAFAFAGLNSGWAGGISSVNHGGIYKWAGNLVGISETGSNTIPQQFQLRQNYPNPFNPSTTIEFSLPKSNYVNLTVYNFLGEEVVTLVAEELGAGEYRYSWDAHGYASGVYFYKLTAGTHAETRKMILLK